MSQPGHLHPAEEFAKPDSCHSTLGKSFDLVSVPSIPSRQRGHGWFALRFLGLVAMASLRLAVLAAHPPSNYTVPVGTRRLHAGRKGGKINQVNEWLIANCDPGCSKWQVLRDFQAEDAQCKMPLRSPGGFYLGFFLREWLRGLFKPLYLGVLGVIYCSSDFHPFP